MIILQRYDSNRFHNSSNAFQLAPLLSDQSLTLFHSINHNFYLSTHDYLTLLVNATLPYNFITTFIKIPKIQKSYPRRKSSIFFLTIIVIAIVIVSYYYSCKNNNPEKKSYRPSNNPKRKREKEKILMVLNTIFSSHAKDTVAVRTTVRHGSRIDGRCSTSGLRDNPGGEITASSKVSGGQGLSRRRWHGKPGRVRYRQLLSTW